MPDSPSRPVSCSACHAPPTTDGKGYRILIRFEHRLLCVICAGYELPAETVPRPRAEWSKPEKARLPGRADQDAADVLEAIRSLQPCDVHDIVEATGLHKRRVHAMIHRLRHRLGVAIQGAPGASGYYLYTVSENSVSNGGGGYAA